MFGSSAFILLVIGFAQASQFSFDNNFEQNYQNTRSRPITYPKKRVSCPFGEVLVEKPEGPKCMRDFTYEYNAQQQSKSNNTIFIKCLPWPLSYFYGQKLLP